MKQTREFLENTPSIAARVIIAEFNLQLSKLSVRKLVQGHLGRADKFAQRVGLAETNLTDHINELAKFDLAIAARVHFLDQIGDLLLRLVFAQMLERNGDLGSVNTVDDRTQTMEMGKRLRRIQNLR